MFDQAEKQAEMGAATLPAFPHPPPTTLQSYGLACIACLGSCVGDRTGLTGQTANVV